MLLKQFTIYSKKTLSIVFAIGFALSKGFFHPKQSISDCVKISIHSNFNFNNHNTEQTFDNALHSFGAYSQDNEMWMSIPYRKSNLGGSGCGILSITNAISLAYNINSKEQVNLLVNQLVNMGDNLSTVSQFLLDDDVSSFIGEIKNNADVIMDGGENESLFSCIENDFESDTYIFGSLYFDNVYMKNIFDMIDHIYDVNPDTNIILYHMTAGTIKLQRPFGSLVNSGHYVTLLINVREFKESNCVYLIDSISRNITGETLYPTNYPFIEKPDSIGLKRFSDNFDVKRISECIIKITGNEQFNEENIQILGLKGGCGVIICPDNITKKDIIIKSSYCKK